MKRVEVRQKSELFLWIGRFQSNRKGDLFRSPLKKLQIGTNSRCVASPPVKSLWERRDGGVGEGRRGLSPESPLLPSPTFHIFHG